MGAAGTIRSPLAEELARCSSAPLTEAQRKTFEALYCSYFDFVSRNLMRLGVPAAATEDALQEVYLVVLRHIDRYRVGTRPKTWLFAIVHRVASTYRRSLRRRRELCLVEADSFRSAAAGPFDHAACRQARRILDDFLTSISDNQRSVFIMIELEQMTAPEVAEALGANLNTVYARLRSARREFTRMLRDRQAAERPDG